MRRQPQQARGQRRVNTILDAASEVFSQLGYEASTTNVIAIRANTSIGSLYQFFPNKEAILDALGGRYHTQIANLLENVFRDPSCPLQTYMARLIDALTEYYITNPAFQPMFHATPSSSAMGKVADDICGQIAEKLSIVLGSNCGTLDPDRCMFYAEIVVYIMRALIPTIKTVEDKERTLREIKRMVLAYLASTGYFDIPVLDEGV